MCKKLILSLLMLVSSVNLHAETAVCAGAVTRLAYHQPGGLYMAVGGSNIFKVCDPESLHKRTTPENCKMIASFASTARVSGKSVKVLIDNATTTSCLDIAAWFAADVRFVELLDN